jgi:hypothetical protein
MAVAVYITKKSAFLRFLTSFLFAAGVAALSCFLLDGPKLGPIYDFLLKLRPALLISRELLIIDSSVSTHEAGDGILEPGAAASLLYTMTELGGKTLIIQVPILGLSAGGTVGEEEILYRFDEEFSVFSRNIQNLFDAIRTGSVAPTESARFVGELVELSEKGKERLISALVRRDEGAVLNMEKAAAFFGHVRRPGDLQVQLIRAGEGGRPGALAERNEYSKAKADRDGVLRRIAPVITALDLSKAVAVERTVEHIIYAALKTRFGESNVEAGKYGPVLAMRDGPDETSRIIPLDNNGAVLFEAPHKGEDFRRIGISDFLAYDEADRNLRRLLSEGETLGIFQTTQGENNPCILYDYALSIREEPASVFSNGDEEKKIAWVEARNRYFSSLDSFLNGPAEMTLVNGYEEIIASEFTDKNPRAEAELLKLSEMRNSLMRVFASIRARQEEVVELRKKLETALSLSFCILGSTQDAEASALLANSILTGRVVKPGINKYFFFGTLLAVFIACLFIRKRGPLSALGTGLLFCLLFGTGLSLSFIFTDFWYDPLVPAASCGTGVLVSVVWALIAKSRYSRRFRQAFGPYVSRPYLKSVIKAGKPVQSQIINARAAVVSVKNADSSVRYAKQVLSFQEKAAEFFIKSGGVVAGTEEDLVIVCFGSPLERIFLASQKEASPYENNINANVAPALRAVDLVSEAAQRSEFEFWHFGLDTGNCAFAWSALSGYIALGAPVQQAKIFSRIAGSYNTRIIVSGSILEAVELPLKKLDELKAKNIKEPFYRLAVKEQSQV